MIGVLPKSVNGQTYASERELLEEQNEILRKMVNATVALDPRGQLIPGVRPTGVSPVTRQAQKEAAQKALAQAEARAANARRLARRYEN